MSGISISNVTRPSDGSTVVKYRRHGKTVGKTAEFLGMDMNGSLSWKPYCEGLCGKIGQLGYQSRMLRNVLTKEQLLSLYYAQGIVD